MSTLFFFWIVHGVLEYFVLSLSYSIIIIYNLSLASRHTFDFFKRNNWFTLNKYKPQRYIITLYSRVLLYFSFISLFFNNWKEIVFFVSMIITSACDRYSLLRNTEKNTQPPPRHVVIFLYLLFKRALYSHAKITSFSDLCPKFARRICV